MASQNVQQLREPESQMAVDDKDYIDAKIDGAEARLDSKVASIEGKVDYIASKLDGLDDLKTSVLADGKTTRWTTIGTGVAVVALLFAVFEWGFGLKTGEQDARIDRIEAAIEKISP